MDLNHRFSVPASPADTWAVFTDLRQVGGCLPGATITDVTGDDFTGTVKIKLGPISLLYNGSGSFVEKDEESGLVVIEAKGKDKRGNGTASATITGLLTPGASGGTDVEVNTDLTITGKPAQFGRNVIQDVSDALIATFVDCIKGKLAAPAAAEAESAAVTAAAAAPAAPVTDAAIGSADFTDPAVEAPAEPDGPKVIGTPADQPFPKDDAPTPPAADEGLVPDEPPTPEPPAPATTSPAASGPIAGPEAAEIDLFATVGPVLVKRYAAPAAGVLGGLLLLRLLVRLLRRGKG